MVRLGVLGVGDKNPPPANFPKAFGIGLVCNFCCDQQTQWSKHMAFERSHIVLCNSMPSYLVVLTSVYLACNNILGQNGSLNRNCFLF